MFPWIGNYIQISPGMRSSEDRWVGNKTLIKTWNKWLEEAVLPAKKNYLDGQACTSHVRSDKWNKTGGVNEGEKWRCVWLEAEYKILRGR